MSTREKFLKQVEAFLEKTGMSPSRFGLWAVNDNKFLVELREGRSVGIDTIDEISEKMRDYKPPKKTKQATNLQHVA